MLEQICNARWLTRKEKCRTMLPQNAVQCKLLSRCLLHTIRKVIAGHGSRRGRVARRESAGGVEEILNGDLGDLGYGQFSLRTFRLGDDVAYPKAAGCLRGNIGLLGVGGGFHGRESGHVVEAQVAEMRELHVVETVRTQPRGVGGCGKRGVIRSW